MSDLILNINLNHHDDLYQILVDLHEGRTEEESKVINAKLIITMMNQIGDTEIIKEIFKLVQQSTSRPE
jgi:uncharacterized radical SAM superfamily protein